MSLSKAVQSATGSKHVVVSGHEAATQIALEVLRENGSIVDAAIAGAAVLCVALPHACGVGGDCFILVHQDGESYCLNGTGRSPSRLPANLRPEQLAGGPLSCSVPGMVGAWEALHRRFGFRPWAQLFAPAIAMATEGVGFSHDLAKALAAHRDRLRADPGCAALFLSEEAGTEEVLIQRPLADTFRSIAEEGAKALYQGEIGAHLCQVVAERGGVLAADDLAAYTPDWAAPIEYAYRGFNVLVPPPNSYAVLLLLQLAALSGVSLHELDYSSDERLRLLIVAAQHAVDVGKPLLADPQRVKSLYPDLPPQDVIRDLIARMTASAEGGSALNTLPPSQGTALISIADSEGNGVSIIQSIFTPFGSHIADAKSGIVLNNRLLGFSIDASDPNCVGPSKRPAHTLSPAMVLQDGRLRLLLNTPGGTGQTITLAQVLTAVVDHGVPLDQAIQSPRWSLDLQGNLLAEPDISTESIQQLNAAGLRVSRAGPEHRFFFGSAECIYIGADMELIAVADNRRDASAGGY